MKIRVFACSFRTEGRSVLIKGRREFVVQCATEKFFVVVCFILQHDPSSAATYWWGCFNGLLTSVRTCP